MLTRCAQQFTSEITVDEILLNGAERSAQCIGMSALADTRRAPHDPEGPAPARGRGIE